MKSWNSAPPNGSDRGQQSRLTRSWSIIHSLDFCQGHAFPKGMPLAWHWFFCIKAKEQKIKASTET